MQANGCEIFETIDTFFTLLQSPIVSEQMTVENVMQAFTCAHFIELTIEKIQAEEKAWIFEKYLRWKPERKLYPRNRDITCSDLERACDKLLERYLKDSRISTEVVDEYLKVYIQHFGRDRLNAFLNEVMSKSISTNMIIESLEELGVPISHMEDEALTMSWQMAIANGDQNDVAKCINSMLNDGHVSRLVHLIIESRDDIIKQLIIDAFTSKLINYDSEICLAFVNIEKKLFFKLLRDNTRFCIDFIDTIFYFGRNMHLVDGKWCSDFKFQYEHLHKMMESLLNGPRMIREHVHNRLSTVKTQPDSEIWCDIETDTLH
ncbi:hypothetical protein DMN91_003174 [Ooceraea biroi]|uniref:Uncharacterized protein n=1 Tax=Ooceraea biroi TaxID=2015173 RepID=A0A3L8DXR2_OOCBI|nr:uncharacterized protein LOC105278703 isoform X1 [Ooceraea biroi]RLU25082.1 hypothetical protein DMN91_003174 [Ooceraea biroi]